MHVGSIEKSHLNLRVAHSSIKFKDINCVKIDTWWPFRFDILVTLSVNRDELFEGTFGSQTTSDLV